jgi:hypothetical protein
MSLTIFTALLFVHVSRVLASNPAPLLISPTNLSTVNSTKLEWLVPAYNLKTTTPYRIQVHSSPEFSGIIYRDSNTTNPNYTPELPEGVWYWRVLARDSNGISSEWSPTSQFTYSTTIVTSSPVPTEMPSPSIAPTSTPTASVSQTVLPNPTSSSSPTSTPTPYFTLSQIPSAINSTQSFNTLISLYLPQSINTTFYLKGAFYSDGSTNYFGQTKYDGNWIKNSQTYSSQFKIQTDGQGKWQGNIEFIPDPQDSGFDTSGEYNFKVGRYSATGTSLTWSDSQTIYITEIINPSPSPSPTVSPSPSLIASSSIQPILSTTISDEIFPVEESTYSAKEATESVLELIPQIATIEGVATVAGDFTTKQPSPETLSLNPGWFYISSGILFLAGIASAFIVKYKPQLYLKKWLFKHHHPKKPNSLPSLWQNDFGPRVE